MKTAVIVVHGVGDPLPGDALRKLLQGLARSRSDVRLAQTKPVSEAYHHTPLEESDLENGVAVFPVNTAELAVHRIAAPASETPDEIHLREVYWGDLSRVKSSAAALAYALFDLIFGLRHIVNAAAKELTGLDTTTGKLASAALAVARGPLFALNILAMVICAVYAVLVQTGWTYTSFRGWTAAHMASVSGAVIVLVAGLLVANRLKKIQWSPQTAHWMVGLGLASLGVSGLMWADLATGLQAYVNIVTLAMTVGASGMAILAIVSILMVLASPWLSNQKLRTARYGPMSAIAFCTTMSLNLFVLVVISIWLLFSQLLEPSAEDWIRRIEECVSQFGNTLENCTHQNALDSVAVLGGRIEGGVHLLPLVLVAFFAMALAFLGVLFGNWIMKWRADGKTRTRYRYIVNPVVKVSFVTLSAFYAVVFFFLAYFLIKEVDPIYANDTLFYGRRGFDAHQGVGLPSQLVALVSWLPNPPHGFQVALYGLVDSVEAYKAIAITITLLFVTGLVWMRVHFLLALDLVLDVIAHFRTGDGDSLQFKTWRAMVERFRLVVEEMSGSGDYARIVIISHSQGTAIALHGLGMLSVRGCELLPARLPESIPLTLVTMGSPVEHLYRYYMPGRYSYSPVMLGRLNFWLNLYRVDDFIGTRVEGVDVPDRGRMPDNRNVGLGGHTDYWCDPRVLVSIEPLLFTQASKPLTEPIAAVVQP